MLWYAGSMTFQLERTSEANCSNTDEPEIFFPRDAKAVKARRWDPYCSSCPIKDMCGKAVYEGFTGVAGGEFHGTLSRDPEPIRKKPRKAQKLPKQDVPRFNVALGAVVRQMRLEQGITLRAFAASAYLSISMISEFERGIVETSSESIAQIAETLGVSQSDLIFRSARKVAEMESAARRGTTSRA